MLQKEIKEEETERQDVRKDMQVLTKRLAHINESLDRKVIDEQSSIYTATASGDLLNDRLTLIKECHTYIWFNLREVLKEGYFCQHSSQ